MTFDDLPLEPGDLPWVERELSEIATRLAERCCSPSAAATPALPGKRYLDWTVLDPEGWDVVEVRRIRDELDLLVTDLLTYLPDADGAPYDPKGTP